MLVLLVAAKEAPYLHINRTSVDIERALAALSTLTVLDGQPHSSLEQMYAAVEAKLASVSVVLIGVESKPSGEVFAVWRHADIRVGHIWSRIYVRQKPS